MEWAKKLFAACLPLALVCGGLAACGGKRAQADPNIPALETALAALYTAPDPELVEALRQTPGPKSAIGEGAPQSVPPADASATAAYEAGINERFGGKLAPEYMEDFIIDRVWPYQILALNTGGAIEVQAVEVALKEGLVYAYSATLLCRNAAGAETTLAVTGTARFNEAGKIENINPHDTRALPSALGVHMP